MKLLILTMDRPLVSKTSVSVTNYSNRNGCLFGFVHHLYYFCFKLFVPNKSITEGFVFVQGLIGLSPQQPSEPWLPLSLKWQNWTCCCMFCCVVFVSWVTRMRWERLFMHITVCINRSVLVRLFCVTFVASQWQTGLLVLPPALRYHTEQCNTQPA